MERWKGEVDFGRSRVDSDVIDNWAAAEMLQLTGEDSTVGLAICVGRTSSWADLIRSSACACF